MESQCGALLEADAKALLSRLKSDAYLTELTGAVSVNFLFIEQASSQRQCHMISDAAIVCTS